MHRSINKIAAFALAVPLAGSLLLAPSVVNASPTVTPSVTKTTSPSARLKVNVTYNRYVIQGGVITYKIKTTNLGPYGSDFALLAAALPKGKYSKARVYGIPTGLGACDYSAGSVTCFLVPPAEGVEVLPKGKSITVTLKVWLKKSTKGIFSAELGAVSGIIPEGVTFSDFEQEFLDPESLLGDIRFGTVKTKIFPRR
ncbi:hypothetical protein [Rhizohabitans arisaemae]|uniref:hypothetical protein n=1 Tax=Rhizohabitans arisaemae TaxID=2720610 RepID=UPI0024B03F19|nr:hypothetical protein [Rhizohabitans arisaemae]